MASSAPRHFAIVCSSDEQSSARWGRRWTQPPGPEHPGRRVGLVDEPHGGQREKDAVGPHLGEQALHPLDVDGGE